MKDKKLKNDKNDIVLVKSILFQKYATENMPIDTFSSTWTWLYLLIYIYTFTQFLDFIPRNVDLRLVIYIFKDLPGWF